MAELFDILDALTTPLKVAWVVWIAWGVGQVYWYRFERRTHAAKPAPGTVRKAFVSKPSTAERPAVTPVTPEQVIAEEPPSIEPMRVESAPPTVETPGQVGELDRRVADFEMNARQRHGFPHNGEASSFDSQLGQH
jgi:hypothetical protein